MHVFVDESYRTSYLLVATYLLPADLGAVRAELRGMCRPGQWRIHFHKESDRRRKTIISVLRATAASARVYEIRGPQERARAAGLTELVTQLSEVRAQLLILETRGHHRDAADRQVIYDALQKGGFEVVYRHVEPRHEPLLWISDAIGWAYGAGGDWARRVHPMISKVVTLP